MPMEKIKSNMRAGQSSALYGIGVIGALIYFIQHAVSFWTGVVGVFKALFWPAFMVYKMFEFLKM